MPLTLPNQVDKDTIDLLQQQFLALDADGSGEFGAGMYAQYTCSVHVYCQRYCIALPAILRMHCQASSTLTTSICSPTLSMRLTPVARWAG